MRSRVTLQIVLVLGLVGAGCGPAEPDSAGQERIAELEAQLADADSRAEQLGQRVEELEAELEAAREDDPDTVAEPPDPDVEVAPPRTPEGLIDQLRAHITALDDSMPAEFEPGATEWAPFEVPAEVQATHANPGAVMTALATSLDAEQLGTEQWETTIRVLLDEDDQDLAHGALLSWGFLDDSVAGRDVRITLTRTADGQWEPGEAEERFQCLRGVTNDGELCL